MSIDKLTRKFKNRWKSKSLPSYSSAKAAICMMDLVAAMKSSEIVLRETATINPVPYFGVSLNVNSWTSQPSQIKKRKDFIRTRNKTFNCSRSLQDLYSRKSLAEAWEYRQQSKPGGCLSQQDQLKPWQTVKYPGPSHRVRDSKISFVCSWSKGTQTNLSPSNVTGFETNFKKVQSPAHAMESPAIWKRRKQNSTHSRSWLIKDRCQTRSKIWAWTAKKTGMRSEYRHATIKRAKSKYCWNLKLVKTAFYHETKMVRHK